MIVILALEPTSSVSFVYEHMQFCERQKQLLDIMETDRFQEACAESARGSSVLGPDGRSVG